MLVAGKNLSITLTDENFNVLKKMCMKQTGVDGAHCSFGRALNHLIRETLGGDSDSDSEPAAVIESNGASEPNGYREPVRKKPSASKLKRRRSASA